MLLLSDQIRFSGASGQLQRMYLVVQAKAHNVDIGRDMMALAFNLRCSKEEQLRAFVVMVYMGVAKAGRFMA
jgi:hypothetical protein